MAVNKSAALWFSFALLLLIGVIVPQLPWSDESRTPPAPDPHSEAIRSRYTVTAEWIAIDDDLQALAGQLDKTLTEVRDETLHRFNAAAAAEKNMRLWIKAHGSRAVDSIEADPAGSQLIRTLEQSYAEQETARLIEAQIKSHQHSLPDLRKQVRKNLLAHRKDDEEVKRITNTVATIRDSAREDNLERKTAVEGFAAKEARSTIQKMIQSP